MTNAASINSRLREQLRAEGYVTVTEFAAEVGCAPSTVGLWCRNDRSVNTALVAGERWLKPAAFRGRVAKLADNRTELQRKMRGQPKVERVELRIDQETLQRWQLEANERGCTLSDFIRGAVGRDYFAHRQEAVTERLEALAEKFASVLGESK